MRVDQTTCVTIEARMPPLCRRSSGRAGSFLAKHTLDPQPGAQGDPATVTASPSSSGNRSDHRGPATEPHGPSQASPLDGPPSHSGCPPQPVSRKARILASAIYRLRSRPVTLAIVGTPLLASTATTKPGPLGLASSTSLGLSTCSPRSAVHSCSTAAVRAQNSSTAPTQTAGPRTSTTTSAPIRRRDDA